LPGLQLFCISCAIAIAAIFILQTSWFVAFMTLDEKRMEEKRNGLIPCTIHKKWSTSKWSKSGMTTQVMEKAAKLYTLNLIQVIVQSIIFLT
jgi:hypothetical protein